MKKQVRFFIFFALISFYTHASHIIGAQIGYEYIGNTSGVTNQYQIILKIFADGSPGTIGLGNTTTIRATSSCSPEIIATLNRDSNTVLVDSLGHCVLSFYDVDIHTYRGTVTLPVTCHDWVFSYDACCRTPGITNLISPASEGIHVDAFLDNTLKNNNSAMFTLAPVFTACIGKPALIPQGVMESDGDSVVYELIAPNTISPAGSSSVSYVSPYSATYPLSTSPANSFFIDSTNAVLSFTPALTAYSQLTILAREYTYDQKYPVMVSHRHCYPRLAYYYLCKLQPRLC